MTRASARMALRLGVLLLAASQAAVACRQRARLEPPIEWTWRFTPSPPVVGSTILTITVHSPSGEPIDGAAIHLAAHMSHPGMAPVLADATARAAGTYDIPFAFTMRGDWVLLVSMTLPDGHRIERRIDVANVRPPR